MRTCKEITRLVASGELQDANWWTRVTVRLHHFMCRHCRDYDAQLRSLGHETRRLVEETAVDRATLDGLQSRILDVLPDTECGQDKDA